MNAPFPFGFPAPTAIYYALYALTLVLHLMTAAYVLGGSAAVALGALTAHAKRSRLGALASGLRDMMPFALGVAITLGVAPLLFLQILYKVSFYSPVLLLAHRFMALLPVLLLGFYLLYLAKSDLVERTGTKYLVPVTVLSFLCFLFVAVTWTENHLLGLQPKVWPDLYAASRMTFFSAEVALRSLLWLTGAVAIMVPTAAWQLRDADARATKFAGIAGLVSLLLALILAATYASTFQPDLVLWTVDSFLLIYSAGGVLGVIALVFGSVALIRHKSTQSSRIAASIGAALVVTATVVAREALRTRALDVESLYAEHARVAESGGVIAFFVFLAINVSLIAYSARLAYVSATLNRS